MMIIKPITTLAFSLLLLAGCSSDTSEDEVDTAQETSEEVEPTDEELEQASENNEEETEEETVEQERQEEQSAQEEQEGLEGEALKEYLRSLATDPESVDERVLEQLELRGLHENTVLYEGRMNPESTAVYFLPDGEGGYEEEAIAIEPNSEGYFTIAFESGEYGANLDTSEKVQLMFTLDDQRDSEQAFHLPIHPAEAGMEVIESHSASQETKSNLVADIELNAIYPTSLIYETRIEDDFEHALYQIDDTIYSTEVIASSLLNDTGSRVITRFPDYPEVGDEISFYIPYQGYILTVNQEVEELGTEGEAAASRIREETTLPASFLEEDLEPSGDPNGFIATGETIPNSTVYLDNEQEQIFRQGSVEEDGTLEFALYPPLPQPGDQIVITIRDENGYTETFEVEVGQ